MKLLDTLGPHIVIKMPKTNEPPELPRHLSYLRTAACRPHTRVTVNTKLLLNVVSEKPGWQRVDAACMLACWHGSWLCTGSWLMARGSWLMAGACPMMPWQ